jgi:hypothetical protein
MFNFLFWLYPGKAKGNQDEYTPKMTAHPQLHDESEGDEFLDDSPGMTEEPLINKDDGTKG